MISKAGKPIKHQKGYTLVVVMVAIIIMAILAEAAISLDSYRVKKSKEAELLFRGMAYQQAIQSYVNVHGSQQRQFPKRLEDLLSDPRFAHRRHIRKLYLDPLQLNQFQDTEIHEQWRILRNEKGGIIGVASKNTGKPITKAFFPAALSHFKDAKQYSDWVFDVN